jgi:hypothetical protein
MVTLTPSFPAVRRFGLPIKEAPALTRKNVPSCVLALHQSQNL